MSHPDLNCKHPDLIVQRNKGVRWVTCTECHTDFVAAREHLEGWCDTCGGSGGGYDGDKDASFVPCSNCDGTGLDPERLERAAKGMQWQSIPESQRGRVRRMTAAAITEYLRKDD